MSLFITVEGPNGVGKSTFIDLLVKKLVPRTIYATKEPSDTAFGCYVKYNEGNLHNESYAYLIAADRCNHIENYIIPALKKYDIVLCDRYIESSLVLQYYDGVSLDLIWKLNEDFLVPDLSIILLAQSDNLSNRLYQRKVLTEFEKRISREDELKLYINAYHYILQRGYNPILLSNDTMEDLYSNIEKIKQLVHILEVDKK